MVLAVGLPVVLGIVDNLLRIAGVKTDWDLMWFGFKIIVLLFVISFVRTRFEGGPIITALVLVLGYLLLFQYWHLFGPIMIIYFAIAFGFTMVLYDLSIAGPMASGGAEELAPDSSQAAMSRRKRMMLR